MAEVDITFEREEREGVVAVGSYLYDAASRLGIRFEDCQRLGESDVCAVTIKKGNEILSEPTKAEIEQLSEEQRKKGERLACQAKFEKSGEVVIMTKEKVEEEKPETEQTKEDFKKEFQEMPLEKKIASLLEFEAIALSETVSFILDSPYAVANKVMEVMAGFGEQMEKESKEATRPEEHRAEKEEANKNGKSDSKKEKEKESSPKKTKPAAKKTAKNTATKKNTKTAEKKKEE